VLVYLHPAALGELAAIPEVTYVMEYKPEYKLSKNTRVHAEGHQRMEESNSVDYVISLSGDANEAGFVDACVARVRTELRAAASEVRACVCMRVCS
jgi:hypothetical protein